MNNATERRRPRPVPLAVAVLALLLSIAGCGAGAGTAPRGDAASAAFRGTTLPSPVDMPTVTLTDASGQPYRLRQRSLGHVTLLYIGYTHCPDECPTTMATLGTAVSRLPASDRARTSVVFITSDPARDTPTRLRGWLDTFNPAFTGLTGDWQTIATTARALGIPVSPPSTAPDGSEVVQHGTEILLFGTDAKARLLYSSDTTADDVTHDVETVLHG